MNLLQLRRASLALLVVTIAAIGSVAQSPEAPAQRKDGANGSNEKTQAKPGCYDLGRVDIAACSEQPQQTAPPPTPKRAPSATYNQNAGVSEGPPTFRKLPLNLFQDQRNFFTSPLRARVPDLGFIVPYALVTTVLAGGADRGVERHLPTSPSLISHSQSFSDYGVAAMAGGAGGMWLLGHARHNDRMIETGFLSGEAALDTFAIGELGKYAFGRQRPLEGDGKGDFFSGGRSFPSEHAALAFSIATVLSNEYPGFGTKLLSYGLASAISAARVTGRQHFTSDVLVGAGLGWFTGRQVYRAHHENNGDLKNWGTFSNPEEVPTSDSMGSPYVTMDSWVYPAFDRLVALGYVQTSFAGLRPWTRLQCAQFLQEASDLQIQQTEERSAADSTYRALAEEFAPELRRLGGAHNLEARLESVYTRVTGISSMPLTDGYHFGQTIINDFGRPYQEGVNNVTGASAYATAGPFMIYMRGEYQHAPSAPAPPLTARQVISQVDQIPLPGDSPIAAVNQFDLLEGYIGVNVHNWQLTFGKQTLWWGPELGGPMMFSDNAEPVNMLRFSRVHPFKLPGIFGRLGPVRIESFLGQLAGYEFILSPSGLVGTFGHSLSRQPFLSGQKISFKPTPNLEFGFSHDIYYGGSGYPFTTHSFLRSLFSAGNRAAGQVDKQGDRDDGLDISYRLPGLRNWLTFYADGYSDDEYSPIAYWDRSVWFAGLYMPQLPKLHKLDLRVEGGYTDNPLGGQYDHGYSYFNVTWRSGHTNNNFLSGNWMGRQGQGAQAWTTWHFNARNTLQFNFRHQKVSQHFIPDGGTLTDASVKSELRLRSDFSVSTAVQYEKWNFPSLASVPRTPVAASIQLTYWPRGWSK